MRILILTEGGSKVGYGHVARTSALGAVFVRRGHSVSYRIRGRGLPPALSPPGADFVDWLADRRGLEADMAVADAVVVDSYGIDGSFLDLAARTPSEFLWFDDEGRRRYPGGIILNMAPGTADMYSESPAGVELLAGERYQVFRDPFLGPSRFTVREPVRRAMVFLGGGQEEAESRVRRILGDFDPKLELVGPRFRTSSAAEPVVFTASETRRAMEEADLCICGGGQSLIEAIRTAVPTIAVELAANQGPNIAAWTKASAVLTAGSAAAADFGRRLRDACAYLGPYAARARISSTCSKVFDGKGGERVVAALESRLFR